MQMIHRGCLETAIETLKIKNTIDFLGTRAGAFSFRYLTNILDDIGDHGIRGNLTRGKVNSPIDVRPVAVLFRRRFEARSPESIRLNRFFVCERYPRRSASQRFERYSNSKRLEEKAG